MDTQHKQQQQQGSFNLKDTMYCAEQIEIPVDLASVLKQFTKDAIRAKPSNLSKWAANYFAYKAGQTVPFELIDDKLDSLPLLSTEYLSE